MDDLFIYNNMGSDIYERDQLFKGDITFTYNTIMVGGINPSTEGGSKKKIPDCNISEYELSYYMFSQMEELS